MLKNEEGVICFCGAVFGELIGGGKVCLGEVEKTVFCLLFVFL